MFSYQNEIAWIKKYLARSRSYVIAVVSSATADRGRSKFPQLSLSYSCVPTSVLPVRYLTLTAQVAVVAG